MLTTCDNSQNLLNEVRVELVSEKRHWQLPQVEFQNAGDHVAVDPGQVNFVQAAFEVFDQLLHF